MHVRSLPGSLSVVLAGGALATGCLTRPVVATSETTKTNFSTEIQSQSVSKIDLLLSIDNSASMGDKQAYLESAIPDLVSRLVTPNCVDAGGAFQGVSHDDGQCDKGQVEFPPVHDLHIAVVSSSLGSRLGEADNAAGAQCVASMMRPELDDHARLVNRSASGAPVADAQPDGFLSWFPSVPENADAGASPGAPPIVKVATLEGDFQDIVTGVGQTGCGIESQLENWYRFLVQPDPYDKLALDANGRASWVGVDQTILAERRDFLRPDSLVAVVVLSDENDSEIDVRSLQGSAFRMMSSTFQPPRGTSICATSPEDPACVPCDAKSTDPNCTSCEPSPDGTPPPAGCATGAYSQSMAWGKDPNLRHVHMKEKYGFDAQYPVERYVTGLTSVLVPDRDGEYPAGAQSYVGDAKCRNPLFAKSLPDGTVTDAATLCNLPAGPRSPDQVFFAHIGGVPYQLLHFTPNDPAASALTATDWVKILGSDPEHHDYTGIDPHMIESVQPRATLPAPGSPDGTDPIHGREWFTDRAASPGHQKPLPVDLQYACTFPVAARDCTLPQYASECDCTVPGIPHEQVPPVCDPNDITSQIRAKAYPTPRELLVAKLMDKQGVVSSICPQDTTDPSPGNPLYGYRPAVASIIDRLKAGLNRSCLPEKLTPDATGKVPCLVLATLPAAGSESACDPARGMSVPPDEILTPFRNTAREKWLANGGTSSGELDPGTVPICAVDELLQADLVNGSCKAATKAGWCYVTGAAADGCEQSVLFAPNTLPDGARVSLECIEANDSP